MTRPLTGPQQAGPGELKECFTRGLIVLDANALFAAYRLPAARAGYTAVLRALRGAFAKGAETQRTRAAMAAASPACDNSLRVDERPPCDPLLKEGHRSPTAR
ncbi:hypothetical protein ACFOY4_08760 [Actinomadura syzygii]|uniref:Uncharacterized protein n=1 Tax=Actinomadura syzygii TaxID=1427538 RepID=A0A5D0UDA5_9ACTN|nr:hypothetical protein [Actinomadura syzygii]TYC16067.1 hypothetical protein FXF65_12160 [Actinomadura syzygii]